MVQLIPTAILIAELGCLAATSAPPAPKPGLPPPPLAPPNLSAPRPGAPMARGGAPPPPPGGMAKPAPYSSGRNAASKASSAPALSHASNASVTGGPGVSMDEILAQRNKLRDTTASSHGNNASSIGSPGVSIDEILAYRDKLRSTKGASSPDMPIMDAVSPSLSRDVVRHQLSKLRSIKDTPPPVKQKEAQKDDSFSFQQALYSSTAFNMVEKTKKAEEDKEKLKPAQPESSESHGWSSSDEEFQSKDQQYSIVVLSIANFFHRIAAPANTMTVFPAGKFTNIGLMGEHHKPYSAPAQFPRRLPDIPKPATPPASQPAAVPHQPQNPIPRINVQPAEQEPNPAQPNMPNATSVLPGSTNPIEDSPESEANEESGSDWDGSGESHDFEARQTNLANALLQAFDAKANSTVGKQLEPVPMTIDTKQAAALAASHKARGRNHSHSGGDHASPALDASKKNKAPRESNAHKKSEPSNASTLRESGRKDDQRPRKSTAGSKASVRATREACARVQKEEEEAAARANAVTGATAKSSLACPTRRRRKEAAKKPSKEIIDKVRKDLGLAGKIGKPEEYDGYENDSTDPDESRDHSSGSGSESDDMPNEAGLGKMPNHPAMSAKPQGASGPAKVAGDRRPTLPLSSSKKGSEEDNDAMDVDSPDEHMPVGGLNGQDSDDGTDEESGLKESSGGQYSEASEDSESTSLSGSDDEMDVDGSEQPRGSLYGSEDDMDVEEQVTPNNPAGTITGADLAELKKKAQGKDSLESYTGEHALKNKLRFRSSQTHHRRRRPTVRVISRSISSASSASKSSHRHKYLKKTIRHYSLISTDDELAGFKALKEPPAAAMAASTTAAIEVESKSFAENAAVTHAPAFIGIAMLSLFALVF